MAGDLALARIVDVGGVVIEGRQRPDHAAHHRHRMGVAAEAAEEGRQLLMHHGVMVDGVFEFLHLALVRQFAVEQQIAGLQEAGMLGQIGDGIAAILQHALVAIDEGDVGLGRSGRGEAGIVGEDVRLVVELADVHDIGALGARKDGEFVILAFVIQAGFAGRFDLALAHRRTPHFPVYLALQYKRAFPVTSLNLRSQSLNFLQFP